jgi:hypothetical protein
MAEECHKKTHTVSIRKSSVDFFSQSQEFHEGKVDAFFDLLKSEFQKLKFKPAKLHNFDGTGISTV